MEQFFQFIILIFFTAQLVAGVFPPIIRSSLTAVAASGDSRAVFVVGPAGPTTNTARLSPEAATAVNELLMMGGKTPETC
jgi:hypothetical protein